MTFAKFCPGGISLRDPRPEYFNCPNCGQEVEVWTHEPMAHCDNCGTPVFREQRPSCIDWCKAAELCFGPQKYRELTEKRP